METRENARTQPADDKGIGVQAVALACVIIGVLVVVWVVLSRPARPRRQFAPYVYSPMPPRNGGERATNMPPPGYFAPGYMMMRGPGFPPRMGTLPRTPTGIPLYIANLATQVGPYMVSVREVLDPDGRGGLRQKLYPNDPRLQTGAAMSATRISIQVMSASPAALQQIDDFAASLTAIDDTGRRLTTVEPLHTIPFNRGLARIVALTAPAPGARYLRSVEGELVFKSEQITPPQDRSGGTAGVSTHTTNARPENRLKFRLENVPLPITPHVMGVAAVATPDSATMKPASARLVSDCISTGPLLPGAKAEALRSLFPPFTPEAGMFHLPSRLILQEDVVNRFRVPLPSQSAEGESQEESLECRLTPHLGPDGEIKTRLTVSEEGSATPLLDTALPLWDNEPVILALPENRSGAIQRKRRPLLLRLHLYLAVAQEADLHDQAVPSPFPVEASKRGGMLTGQVFVKEEPLKNGSAGIEITRLDGPANTPQETKTLEAPLDKQGQWWISNLTPGRYRLLLRKLEPSHSPFAASSRWEEYCRRRYGVTNAVWQNALQDNITLRAGSQVTLKPWRILQSPRSTTSGTGKGARVSDAF